MSDLSPDAQLSRACELVVTPRGPDLYVPDALARRLLAEGEQRIRDLDSDIVRAEARLREVTEALIAARGDIVGVNAAQFDSTRGEVALRAIKRIDTALEFARPLGLVE